MVIKRDGRRVPFDKTLIHSAVYRAAVNDAGLSEEDAHDVAILVMDRVAFDLEDKATTVEEIQDHVEHALMDIDPSVAKQYIIYRKKRSDVRENKTSLMHAMEELVEVDSLDSDEQRENGNIDAGAPMGLMLKFGEAIAKDYFMRNRMSKKHADAHRNGDYYQHDLGFHAITTNCCQIDITKLFDGGFSTGHSYLREPQDIRSYAALSCIAVQSVQNSQFGGTAIAKYDYDMAPGVAKTFVTEFCNVLDMYINMRDYNDKEYISKDVIEEIRGKLKTYLAENDYHIMNGDGEQFIREIMPKNVDGHTVTKCINKATQRTDKATYQAMEAAVHNFSTMASRAGAQVPFSSVNFGTDTSSEGRMVSRNLLLVTEHGVGFGQTAIFPISIFKVRKGYNAEPGDRNYDLFQLACRVSAKRLYPNFLFLDSSFNAPYMRGSDPNRECATMGCRTRVIGNIHDPEREVTCGRGNLSFTTLNIVRLAIEAKGDIDLFFKMLDERIDDVFDQLIERFEIQGANKIRNFPALMSQGVWLDSDKLNPDDTVREILKHGSLSLGFINLASTLILLTGKHHGESEEAQALGLKIVGHMRKRCDDKAKETGLNFSLIGSPAEGLCGKLLRIDRERYGVIEGVTDREYYTNSFHVPVWFPITAQKKIEIEAPYHALCNAGHITYVEIDGDPTQNVEAFEALIKYMGKMDCGYVSINHPVDYCPVCRYTGIIGDTCPRCGRKEGEGISEELYEEIKKKYW